MNIPYHQQNTINLAYVRSKTIVMISFGITYENNQLSQYLNNNLVNVSNNIFYDPNTNSLNTNKYLIKLDSIINKI